LIQVFRIRDVLIWRIRIRGSVLLDYGFGAHFFGGFQDAKNK
jgi:hypothetical protein